MEFKIVPMEATYEEIEESMAVGKKAFGPDPLLQFCLFNRPGRPQESTAERVKRDLAHIGQPQFLYYKAVDAANPNGPMLGKAVWHWVENPQTEPLNGPWGDWPPWANIDCLEASIGAVRRWRLNHFRQTNEPYLYLSVLVVLPEEQRRGIGHALMLEGLKHADERGLPAYVDASPWGLGLYKKCGYEEVVQSTVNLKDFGGDDYNASVVGLIRPGKAK